GGTYAVGGEGVYWYNLAQAASNTSGRVQLLPPSITALAIDAQGRVLVGTDGGVWRGVNHGYGYDFTSGGQGIINVAAAAALGQRTFRVGGMSLTALNGNLQISDVT